MRPALALLALAALTFFPFFGFPEWRGTEARRVQIAAEMVETGDYIVPRLWGEPTYAKPPFYYWVLAGSFRLFGVHWWSARLPSVLAFWLLAVVGYRFLRRWHDETAAALGAGGVLISPVVIHDVPFAEIDPLFAVLTAWSILCLCDGVLVSDRKKLLWAGVLGGLAVLTKGPPYLMFCLGPFVLWWKHNRLRGVLLYLPLVFVFWGAYKLVLDADEVSQVAVQETVGRLRFWEWQSLKGIPGHLLASLFLLGLPFSFFVVRWSRETRRAEDLAARRINFLIWGALSAALILVFSRDRSTRYMLPAIPLLMFGLAPVVARVLHDERPPPDWIRWIVCVVGAAAGVGAVVMPWVPHPYPGTTSLTLLALGCIALVVHSRGQLVRFSLLFPVVFAWTALPDRVRYTETAHDFVPARAAVLARELSERGIREIETHEHVGTAILLHARERFDGELRILGDYYTRRPEKGRFVVVVDRGAGFIRPLPGYRDVLRVQLDRKKSLSLREKQ